MDRSKEMLELITEESRFNKLQRRDLGVYSFVPILHDQELLRFIWQTILLKTRPYPHFLEIQISQKLKESLDYVHTIISWDSTTPLNDHENFIESFRKHIASLHDTFMPYIVLFYGSEEYIKNLKFNLDFANTLTDSGRAILTKAENYASARAASSHANDFDEQATRHFRASIAWLVVIALLSVITASLAIKTYINSIPGETVSLNQITSKIILFGLLLFLVSNASKLYKMNVSQKLVNQGKAHSLRTFEMFVQNSKDDATKAAVLLQTTATIFGPVITGLSGHDKETQIMPVSIDTVIRSLSTK